jgi:hypothetical protein
MNLDFGTANTPTTLTRRLRRLPGFPGLPVQLSDRIQKNVVHVR